MSTPAMDDEAYADALGLCHVCRKKLRRDDMDLVCWRCTGIALFFRANEILEGDLLCARPAPRSNSATTA